jgi:hypothetical protein
VFCWLVNLVSQATVFVIQEEIQKSLIEMRSAIHLNLHPGITTSVGRELSPLAFLVSEEHPRPKRKGSIISDIFPSIIEMILSI